jgi:erythronate-4-phosphate dehydrogenase
VLKADFVSLHVPLTGPEDSRYPTRHMIGAAELAAMRPEAYLLNTSRGAVVDSEALAAALEEGALAGAVLDVYEGEPEPPEELIRLPELATPHIAGYAVEGKRRGAVVIYEAACRALGVEPVDTSGVMTRGFAPPEGQQVDFDGAGADAAAADRAVRALLRAAYDIEATSAELKATLGHEDRGARFDQMRREHDRHELAVYRVGFGGSVAGPLRERIGRRLEGFGVQVAGQGAHYVLRPR